MNKEDLLKDLTILQQRHHKILGAIEYILGKIGDIEILENEEKNDMV